MNALRAARRQGHDFQLQPEINHRSKTTMNRFKKQMISVGLALGATIAARATPFSLGDTVPVQERSFGPHETATIHSSTLGTVTTGAGILKLMVNGMAFDAFCIDPYQYSSSSSQQYTVAALATAPVPAMGAAAARTVGKLWSDFHSTALGDPTVAAGLQIAIWETVAGSNFSVTGSDFGAAGMIAAANAQSGIANLWALASAKFQDYVIAVPPDSVPDGGSTVLLLGIALIALALLLRWRQRALA
jgi:hypothetical protein